MSVDSVTTPWPLSRSRPRRRVSQCADLDDNVALYNETDQLLILLNRSAAAVWELCDGARTLSEIVDVIARTHPAEAGEIPDDVRRTVRKLAELGLVDDAAQTE